MKYTSASVPGNPDTVEKNIDMKKLIVRLHTDTGWLPSYHMTFSFSIFGLQYWKLNP
jgi:hypothetical protein